MIRNNVTIPGKIPSTGNLIPVCFVQTGTRPLQVRSRFKTNKVRFDLLTLFYLLANNTKVLYINKLMIYKIRKAIANMYMYIFCT